MWCTEVSVMAFVSWHSYMDTNRKKEECRKFMIQKLLENNSDVKWVDVHEQATHISRLSRDNSCFMGFKGRGHSFPQNPVSVAKGLGGFPSHKIHFLQCIQTFWLSHVERKDYSIMRATNRRLTGRNVRARGRRVDQWLQSVDWDCGRWGTDMWRELSVWVWVVLLESEITECGLRLRKVRNGYVKKN